MVSHEEDIRLGDEGWKERYYQVSLIAAADMHEICLHPHAFKGSHGLI